MQDVRYVEESDSTVAWFRTAACFEEAGPVLHRFVMTCKTFSERCSATVRSFKQRAGKEFQGTNNGQIVSYLSRIRIHSLESSWKWKMAPWMTIFLYK